MNIIVNISYGLCLCIKRPDAQNHYSYNKLEQTEYNDGYNAHTMLVSVSTAWPRIVQRGSHGAHHAKLSSTYPAVRKPSWKICQVK